MSTAVVQPQQRRRPHSGRSLGDGDRVTTRNPRPARASARLTRRGRLVVFMSSTALALGAFTLIGGPAASTGEEHHPVTETVVVAPGETLWDIADRTAPGEDPRVLIAEIVDLNGLSDAGAIRVGQPLHVPVD